ncbi:MAG: DUF4405 domain-containing protein [Methyloprofundus sp.]|nr:DUF4405 domain-containing protein [Methyloprofundus sp.]MDT8426254.1 DUF4405 domain-containing protein [Methyloprofundus sp.]
MNRVSVNFIIDAIALIGFVFLAVTGVLMYYILPPGSGAYMSLWGLNRHDWGELHFCVSLLFFAVLSVHLVLHWRWIICALKGKASDKSGVRLGLGLLGLVILIAFAVAPFFASPEYKAAKNHAMQSGKGNKNR